VYCRYIIINDNSNIVGQTKPFSTGRAHDRKLVVLLMSVPRGGIYGTLSPPRVLIFFPKHYL
jgi:hypothetical protein